jgi:hypothetical protein
VFGKLSTNSGSEPRDEICCVISGCPLIKDFSENDGIYLAFGEISCLYGTEYSSLCLWRPSPFGLTMSIFITVHTSVPVPSRFVLMLSLCVCVCAIYHNWYPPFRFPDEIHIQTKHFIWYVFAQKLISLIRWPSFTCAFNFELKALKERTSWVN